MSIFHIVEEIGGLLELDDQQSVDSFVQNRVDQGPELHLTARITAIHFFLFSAAIIASAIIIAWCSYKTNFRICRWACRSIQSYHRPPGSVLQPIPTTTLDHLHRQHNTSVAWIRPSFAEHSKTLQSISSYFKPTLERMTSTSSTGCPKQEEICHLNIRVLYQTDWNCNEIIMHNSIK